MTGSVPAGGPPATRTAAVLNPTLYFAQSLRDGLVGRGIAVTGPGVDVDDIDDWNGAAPRRVLAESRSVPLREIATVMMKVSQNLYAETLLKAVGAATTGFGTAEAGRAAARDVFARWGIAGDGYAQVDGSGLSRYDYLTADMIVTILDRMFARSLPQGGVHRHAPDRGP